MPQLANWRVVVSGALAVAVVLITMTVTSRAANTIGWQPAASGLPSAGYVRDVAFGDVNNDGRPDLVVAYANGKGLSVHAGNGAGIWASSGMTIGLPATGHYERLALGDLNDDGKLDIVATGGANNGVAMWRGNGFGSWAPLTQGLPGTGSYAGLAVGDVDRDGFVDVLAAGSGGTTTGIKVFLNRLGYFSQTVSITTTGNYNEIAAGYVDSDGYLDLAAGNNLGGLYFWRGTSNNGWVSTSAGLAATTGFRGVAFGDINRDGKPDLLASRTGVASTSGGGLFAFLWNDMTDKWSLAPGQIPGNGSYGQISLDDINNDGWLDIVAGGFPTQGTLGVYSWLGGAAGFSAGPPLTITGSLPAVSLADFNRDGLIDVAAGDSAGAGIRAWRNDGGRDNLGGWTVSASPQITGSLQALAEGDLNRDGFLDVVLARPDGGLGAWKGDGGNGWASCGLTANAGTYESAVIAPFTYNSQFPDVIGARWDGSGITHFVNNSGYCYWNTNVITGSGSFRGLSAGDIDGNGRYDLVAARYNSGLRVWEYGANGWSFFGSPATTGNYYDTALGDFNHDGKLDIVAAAYDGTGVRIFESANRSWLTHTVTAIGEFRTVAVGDLNNDGHLDIVAAKNGAEQGIYIWLGNASGTSWSPWHSPTTAGQYYDIDLGDFNHDGKLDILAARDGLGVSLWAGNGAGGWTPANANLPGSGSSYNAHFGHVDRDGNLDILSTRLNGGLRIWTAAEATPPTLSNLQPTTWVTTTKPTVYAKAIDSGTGISVTSALYRYSTDGGTSWSAFASAAASGFDGITGTVAITAANVPFDQDSATKNVVELSIADIAGNIATAQLVAKVDSTPPTAPTSLTSSNVSTYVWSKQNQIVLNWSGAADATSGVNSYSVLFDQSATTLPDTTSETSFTSLTSAPLPEGDNWYAHIRTRDMAGNWSTTAKHRGPFLIDTTKPTNPGNITGSPVSLWTKNNTVHVAFSGATDAGILVMGYSIDWTTSPSTIPDTVMDTIHEDLTSPLLPDGDYYFHVRTVDGAGNVADGAKHYGPVKIDSTPPSSSVTGPSGNVDNVWFQVDWSGSDARSGVWYYDVEYRDVTTSGPWVKWHGSTSLQSDFFQGKAGHKYQFRSRATDMALNVEDWPATYDNQVFVLVDTMNIATDPDNGLEVTQAVQDLENNVVLIAGKTTFVRFHVYSLLSEPLKATARLRGERDGKVLGYLQPGNKGGTVVIPQLADRGVITDSFWFQLPSDWTTSSFTGGLADPPQSLTLVAEVNYDKKVTEIDYSDNTATATVNFNPALPLKLVLMEFCYSYNGKTYYVDTADRDAITSWLKRAYPISTLNVGTRKVDCYSSPPSLSTALELVDEWQSFSVDELTRYYGMINHAGYPKEGITVGLGQVGWYAAVGLVGKASERPAYDWIREDRFSGFIAGHELGHNYWQRHVACSGTEKNVNTDYPYPGGRISLFLDSIGTMYGFDIKLRKVYGPEMKDIMTYCPDQWISDYTYENIRGFMYYEKQKNAAVSLASSASGEFLIVAGSIVTATDEVTLRSFYRLPYALNARPPGPGEYSIRLLDGNGSALYDHPFGAGQAAHGTDGEILFRERLPWMEGTARVAIFHGASELASRTVSANSPTVAIQSPNGGESLTFPTVTMTWNASDSDGNSLVYTLLYSSDGGATWQPLGTGLTQPSAVISTSVLAGTSFGRIRVIASDGVNTGTDDSDADFSVPAKTPELDLLAPLGGSTFGYRQTVGFEAEAYDVEDGSLPDTAFAWTSSLNGALGTGRNLATADLLTGTHTITVTATDSDGHQALATTVVVVNDPDEEENRPYVNLFFQPSPVQVASGKAVTLEMWVDAGSLQVAAVDAFLDYDPVYVEIVNGTGSPVSGTAFISGTALPVVSASLVDNAKGQAVFAAGIGLGAPPASGRFLLGAVRLNVREAPPPSGSTVQFHFTEDPNDRRNTLVADADGNPLSASFQAGTLQTAAASLRGSVQLQGRGHSPNAGWQVPLSLTLHSPGVATPTLQSYSTTDEKGEFTVIGLPAGSYDVKLKKAHSLANKLGGVTIMAGDNSFDFGMLLEGDANDDGIVNSLDYAPLATTYYRRQGEPDFDERVDFNGDGRTNALDYAFLAGNYMRHSDIPVD